MKGGRGVLVKAFGRFTSDRAFAIQFVFQGPLSLVKSLLRRGFPYTLRFEDERGEGWAFALREDFEGTTMWNAANQREAMEILGCIVERGGFEEEFHVTSESRSCVCGGFRRMSEDDRRIFREILEASVDV